MGRLSFRLALLCLGLAAPAAAFTVVNNGATSYTIDGQTNPTLTLTRGVTYTFEISSLGHPFWIKAVQSTGTGNAFSTGVTNNGIDDGTLTFSVPASGVPNQLFYDCQFHSSMTGVINIVDGATTTTNSTTSTTDAVTTSSTTTTTNGVTTSSTTTTTTTDTTAPTTTTTETTSTSTSTPTTTTGASTTSTTLPPLCDTAPRDDCQVAALTRKTLRLRNATKNARDTLSWTWANGAAITREEFGDPRNASTTLRVCVYDGSASAQPLLTLAIPGGGACSGSSCWKAKGRSSFVYRNPAATPDGVTVAMLAAGATGKARIQVTARGSHLVLPPAALAAPVTVQFVAATGSGVHCWQTR